MTKPDEIEILRDAARRLGPDSYCGPWLAEQIQFIEADIRSDFPPSPTLKYAESVVEAARAKCGEAMASAEREAARRVDAACTQAERIRAELRAEVQRAERVLGSIAERM